MNNEVLLQMGLTEAQTEQVARLHAEAVRGFVPKEQLDTAMLENGQLTAILSERDKQLKDLKDSAVNNKELQEQLAAAIAKNKADSEAAAKELAAYKKNSAVDLYITKVGAKNPKTVKALLDMDKIRLDGEDLLGLAEQCVAIKASDAYLFDSSPKLYGRAPSAGSSGAAPGEPKDNPFKKESYNLTRQADLYKQDPEQAKRLAAAAGAVPAWMA
ncbi:MAG: phage scaffolding protein [Defluviitaleaceae bacterium]|nr:phage scaffolding protein [Defluviitaleaceae bacterium]